MMYEGIFQSIRRHLARRESRQAMKLLADNPDVINYHSTKDIDGDTLLHKAIFYNHEEMTTWILNYGVDLLSKDKYGTTPLHGAFILKHGAIAALLYYYEQQIPDHPLREENTTKLTTLFFAHRSEFHTKAWHDEQKTKKAFRTKIESLSREHAQIPKATLELTLKNLGRLHSESKVSDGSGSGSAPSEVVLTEDGEKKPGEGGAGANLRHRTVFATAAGAPESDAEALLGEHS